MYARTIKKGLLLFVIDALFIIGIFILQFRSDSIISIITEKNGSMTLTLSETKDSSNNSILKNKLQLAFNGITISVSDQMPAFIVKKDSNIKENIALTSWKKPSDLSYEFGFTDDVAMTLELTDQTETGGLSITVNLPSDVESFYIPYSLASNIEVLNSAKNRVLIGTKKHTWEFLASSVEEQYLCLNSKVATATYSYFENTKAFTFDSITDLAVQPYSQSIRAFKDNLIAAFKSSSQERNEQAVVAYVAQMAAEGKYAQAINEIPMAFKQSPNRTYLSASFFNSLDAMDDVLQDEINQKASLIQKASDSNSISIFTVRDITNFMYIYPNTAAVRRLMEHGGQINIDNCSIAECAGILRVYVEMNQLSKALARHLGPSLEKCVEKIEKSCKMEGTNLTISENGTFLSVVQAIEVADALLRYGEFTNNPDLVRGGQSLIISYLGESSSFDLRTLSDLYPVLVHDNTYYPHFVKLYTEGDDVVWAWTCAQNITYEQGADRSLTFNIEFPKDFTHYVILRGVKAFRSIYIYDMAFRTDPRFETYNSSGYIYKNKNRALLLKSRHKTDIEPVRLSYAEVVQKPVEEAPAENVESTTEPAEESSVETETPADTATETTSETVTE